MRKIEVEEVTNNQDHLTKLKNNKKNLAQMVKLQQEQIDTAKQLNNFGNLSDNQMEQYLLAMEKLKEAYTTEHNEVVKEIAVIEHGIK